MFESAKELQEKIDAYFADCDPHMEEKEEWVYARDKDGSLLKDEYGLNYLVPVKHKVLTEQKPYTITSLAVWLGTSRQALLDYEGRKDYLDTIKAAKARCEAFAADKLYSGGNVQGVIFSLKNNYNWKDKTEVEGTGTIKIVSETQE